MEATRFRVSSNYRLSSTLRAFFCLRYQRLRLFVTKYLYKDFRLLCALCSYLYREICNLKSFANFLFDKAKRGTIREITIYELI